MLILAFVLLALAGVVAFVNMEIVPISLYFTTISLPMWAILVSFLIVGMLVAALFASSKGASDRQKIKNKNKEIKRLEEERESEIDRVRNEKESEIERIRNEKEEAIQRMKAEKNEAIERTQRESDLQMELQNREAEIRNLETKIEDDRKNSTMNDEANYYEDTETSPSVHEYEEEKIHEEDEHIPY